MIISDKEIAILSQLGSTERTISQRNLAKGAGVSVGLVNLVLQKMIRVGYVKAKALNKRQLKYCLTPSGFVSVAHRSRSYIARTVEAYQALQNEVDKILQQLHHSGYRHYAFVGEGVVRNLAESRLALFNDVTIVSNGSNTGDSRPYVLINVEGDSVTHPKAHVVNLLEEIRLPMAQS